MSNYYDINSKEYIAKTKNSDMTKQYSLFEKYFNKPINILDIGFGSGRDSLYFESKGYEVYSIDSSKEMCLNAKELGLKHIFNMNVEDLSFNLMFDGIWACASLLHVNKDNLKDVFNRCYKALNDNGIMYCSFKYGDFEGIRDNRYYIDLSEESIRQYIGKFNILEISITGDVLNRDNKWLNVILKK